MPSLADWRMLPGWSRMESLRRTWRYFFKYIYFFTCNAFCVIEYQILGFFLLHQRNFHLKFQARYKSFSVDIGAKIKAGSATLEECEVCWEMKSQWSQIWIVLFVFPRLSFWRMVNPRKHLANKSILNPCSIITSEIVEQIHRSEIDPA